LVGWIVAPPRSPSLLQLIESNMLVRPWPLAVYWRAASILPASDAFGSRVDGKVSYTCAWTSERRTSSAVGSMYG